jgi:hypothetical protein
VQLMIKSALRRVWRAADSLQIGLSQRRGVVLDGLRPGDVPLLEQLRDGFDAATLESDDQSLVAARRRELVRLLARAEVLVSTGAGHPPREQLGPAADRLAPDAAIWSVVHPRSGDGWSLVTARAGRRVVIVGAGRLGSILAATLAAAGVGQVAVGDQRQITPGDLIPGGARDVDLGRPREEAALDAVRQLGGQAERVGSAPGRWLEVTPDLVILIEHGAADATAAGQLVSADVPHLSVVIREDDVVIGPLVRPGNGPCLRCLDLHRGDRDPAWPAVLTQLLGPAARAVRPEETALSVLGAGLAALQALAHLDGVRDPATVGATLEAELPDGLIARRSWPAHPRCGCHWPLDPGRPTRPTATAPDNLIGPIDRSDPHAQPAHRVAGARRTSLAERMGL